MVDLNETTKANINLALHGGQPVFPLSKGLTLILFVHVLLPGGHNLSVRYPIYDGYPKHIVDLEVEERKKVLALEKELVRRESSLNGLQKQLQEVEDEHGRWMSAHSRGMEAELQHRRDLMVSKR